MKKGVANQTVVEYCDNEDCKEQGLPEELEQGYVYLKTGDAFQVVKGPASDEPVVQTVKQFTSQRTQ